MERHFNTHGAGEITEIKLMSGFGFIEYKDAQDARDVVPGMSRSNGVPKRNLLTLSQHSVSVCKKKPAILHVHCTFGDFSPADADTNFP